MSQQTQGSGTSEFGPNQWLVDALREQWQEDPSSVDPSWAEYFSSHAGVTTESPVAQEPAPGTSPAATEQAEEPPQKTPPQSSGARSESSAPASAAAEP
ncbi:MAG: hypothetical protein L0G94_05485, partial [Brachybacterium sp.]|uniref:2-oxoglutarate dehydrogenase E1 subunit family protein n=1 Tax=Brachybacterium sp. TaxID=1891286 RepID=UPI00264835B5